MSTAATDNSATSVTSAPAATDTRGARKRVIGKVVSDKMTKSIVVQVTDQVRHPMYGKFIKRNQKFHAHDETNDAKTGDTVELIETRPLSKTKRWRLVKVITRAI